MSFPITNQYSATPYKSTSKAKTKNKPQPQPKPEPKPKTKEQPGVINFDPIVIEAGKGDVTHEGKLDKNTKEVIDNIDKIINGSSKKGAATFNSAALQRSMNLNSNSSDSQVFSAIGSRTW